jgi:regulatory protein
VNDAAFTEQKITSLRRKGASARAITMKLREKGIKAVIESSEDDELAAAQRYIKRKRLGPFRTRVAEDSKQKDIAALARAGFALPIARKALASIAKE